ncbi:MAG: hypothetical protein LAN18_12025 [Acidobacteriia bacterium]|nr:hypothetical protein [Terriglobia bacterium]
MLIRPAVAETSRQRSTACSVSGHAIAPSVGALFFRGSAPGCTFASAKCSHHRLLQPLALLLHSSKRTMRALRSICERPLRKCNLPSGANPQQRL